MGQNALVSNLGNLPLSPLDGRYQAQVAGLSEFLSEAGLNQARIQVEIEWLIALANEDLLQTGKKLSAKQVSDLRSIAKNFSASDIKRLAKLEATTKHDVKAVEYFIREELSKLKLDKFAELTHFGCTSEDVNNLAYAITVRDATEKIWLPKARLLIAKLSTIAKSLADVPMLARTHGQPATPTTMGKEIAVFVARLQRQLKRIENQEYLGKFSGATGTFAAHVVAAPKVNWPAKSASFVKSLGLSWNGLTTQIESHDWQAELYASIAHFNRISHNLATDIWHYISLNYFKQIPVKGATGSSTMPHKVNPIRFENAEANLEIANAILDTLASTLVTSRLQRDLTDSSSQRNIGVGFGHSLLALDNLIRGLDEIAINQEALEKDLLENWEVLGEAIQTVIRAEVARGNSKISDPYALLKELTRGKKLTEQDLREFVSKLDIPQDSRARLKKLKPTTYVGVAQKLVKLIS